MITTATFDHHNAIDAAMHLTPAPAVRAFERTGALTPGFRAAVQLHDLHSGGIDELVQYVNDRVAAGETAAPKNWPN